MKDYYKILGVKKDANQEQIRDRYVELAKLYHPDLRKSGKESDRIKEVNEAYEVLKDDRTRMDYDLRMSLRGAYLKIKGKERGGSWLTGKLLIPLPILFVIILLFSLFLWEKPAVHVRSSLETYHPIISSAAGGVRNSSGPLNLGPQGGTPPRSEPEIIQKSNPAPPIPGRQPEPETQVKEVISKTSLTTVYQERSGDIGINSMATGEVLKEVIPSNPPKEIVPSQSEKAKPDLTNPPPLTPSKAEPPINIALSSPDPLVEGEVRQFLDNYIDRYVRKDIHGFLALFSPKAIQNGKDGPEKIREVYDRFFDQSEELTYRLDDTKISIHGGEAEAMARYQVIQRLKNRGGEKLWKGNIRWVLVNEDGALKILSLDYQHEKAP